MGEGLALCTEKFFPVGGGEPMTGVAGKRYGRNCVLEHLGDQKGPEVNKKGG